MPPFFIPPGRRAANIGLTGIRPAIGAATVGAAIALRILGIMGMINSLTGVFLVLVHVLYNLMVQLVASSMLFVVMMVMNVTTFFMFFHVVNMVLVLMRILMASWVNVLVVLVMFAVHGTPHFL